MKAGRELDALVAEKVMGWVKYPSYGVMVPPGLHPYANIFGHEVPHYSTDIEAAWKVVEKITKSMADITDSYFLFDGLGYRCCEHDEDGVHGRWRCSFMSGSFETKKDYWATSDTAPEAICLAALKAVGAELSE